MYCRVIVDIVHENVAKPFTYLIPESMELCAGQRVAVPFGRREKEGVVVEITDESDVPAEKLREVIRPLEDYAAIPPELMALAEEMAVKAHCPLAETLRLMLPAQMRGGRVHVKTVRGPGSGFGRGNPHGPGGRPAQRETRGAAGNPGGRQKKNGA